MIRRAGEGTWVMEVTRSGEDLSFFSRKVLLECKRVRIESMKVEWYTKWDKEIWARQESVKCRWSGKECDYEGVGGKGYCEGCAREYSGTR